MKFLGGSRNFCDVPTGKALAQSHSCERGRAIVYHTPLTVYTLFCALLMRRWAMDEERKSNHLLRCFSIESAQSANEDDRAPVMADAFGSEIAGFSPGLVLDCVALWRGSHHHGQYVSTGTPLSAVALSFSVRVRCCSGSRHMPPLTWCPTPVVKLAWQREVMHS